MVNKFKALLKKEKGFTLVELLAVIVILGIIVAIAIPAIGNIIDRASGDADTAEVQLILDAARLYDVQEDFVSGTTKVSDLVPEYLDIRGSDYPEGINDDSVIYKDTNGAFTFENPGTGG